MPFADYKSMADCVSKNKGKVQDPKAYCATIMRQVKKSKDYSMHECWMCDRSSFATRESLEDHAEAVHTHSEVHELLRKAIREEHGGDSYLRDAADDWVVWMEYGDGPSSDRLLKASYTISDDGTVTLGDPVEVRRKTTYPQVPGGDEAAWLQFVPKGQRVDTSKDYSKEKRKEFEKKGWAMSGGKFPIADCGDVKDAISRLGQQKGVSNAAVKKHIKKRAKALGCSLPDDWT